MPLRRLIPALLFLPALLRAQTPELLRSTTSLVQVPTLVRQPDGALIHTLQASDFRLTDNGISQTLTLENEEHADHQPISLVVVMQTGGDAPRQFPNYPGIPILLETLVAPSPHRAAVITFDSTPEDIYPFTPHLEDLREAFSKPIPGDSGAALYDALATGMDLLEKESAHQPPQSQRILLLLSQTADSGSKLREQDILTRLGRSDILVYSLTFSPEKTWLKDQFTKPRQGNPPYQFGTDRSLSYTFNLDKPLREALHAMRANAAAQLATLSGGATLPFGNRHDLEQQLSVLANLIPNRYLLTFRPTDRTPGLHTLTLTIPSNPTLQISARSAYFSTPAPN